MNKTKRKRMCVRPRLMQNKKYVKNKKNGGNVPIPRDNRVLKVPIGCGKCMECKNQKAGAWSVRLQEEIRENENGKFVTLTFSNEQIRNLILGLDTNGEKGVGRKAAQPIKNLDGYELDNEIAKVAVARFLERWRKEYGKSLRHWLVTELGGNGTENIHLHGIIWTDESRDTVERIWKYGYIWPHPEMGWKRNYVNDATVNYCVKYTTKTDSKHPGYNARVLTSPGMGKGYIKRLDAKLNKYKPGETDETYTTRQGHKRNLTIYWRNQIYTEEQRENLWLEKLDKQERWVDGIKVSTATPEGIQLYYRLLEQAQEKSIRLGYIDTEHDWQKETYERERRRINYKKRLEKFENMKNDDKFVNE